MSAEDFQEDFLRPRLSPGTRLNGIYEIDHPIGLGGMGEIYKGHLVETGDPVAIKMMLPEMSDQAAFTLFRKEASALHHIQHDAVVRYYVFTVEPVLRRPYLAMEFVEGRTLTDILHDDGPLSFEAVQSLLLRLASGLQAAHDHGIVHRDISPDNIMIPNNDVARAKIIDFGIARTTQHGTVISGGFAGKFNYVSPEQLGLFGGEVTAKSDIYSLGLVLVQALTGKPLDMGGSQVEIIEKRRKVPDLGAIDMRLRPLLERMLQPDPAERPETMTAVAALAHGSVTNGQHVNPLLHDIATERFPSTPQTGPARRWKRVAAGLISIALVCGGSAALFFTMRMEPSNRPSSANSDNSSTDGKGLKKSELTPPLGGPPSGATISSVDKINAFIEQYDGGSCFFIAPVAVTEHAAAIEGFGSSVEPFRSFDAAFQRANGFEADIGVRQITEQQCPAITFLARLRGEKARALHLDIDREDLRSGETLKGMVDRYGTRNVELILVSDAGTVQNISNLLKSGTDAKTFNIGLQRTAGAAGRQPQLLIAVANQSPINALQATGAASADQFFELVLSEAEKSAIPLSAAARYFMLEK